MKKYLIWAAIILAVAAAFWVQQSRIKRLTDERDKYRSNTETLLQDVRTYQTKDSLNAAKVGNLELKLSEYKKYRADDAALIKSLQTKNRDLQRVTTAQMKTINELRANVRDSIVYLPGDTVTTVLRCIEYSDKWVDLDGCIINNTFSGKIITRDSLLITESVQYKRWLGFLWKTKRIKDREFDIVSKNPNSNHRKITIFAKTGIVRSSYRMKKDATTFPRFSFGCLLKWLYNGNMERCTRICRVI